MSASNVRWSGRVFAACLFLLLSAGVGRAGDWPAYRHDIRRSAVTEEQLALPLKPAWRYTCAQPPAPAWPDTYPQGLLNRMDFDYAPALVIAGGLVVFGSSSDDTVRALDVKTGAEKWHFITGGPVRFAPQIDKGRVYFASDDGFIYCLDAGTGKPAWKFNAAPADERLAGNHRMISVWPVRTGVLVADGVVYGVAGMWPAEGVFIYALQADTGKVLWCNDTVGGTPQGALLLGGDVLLVPGGNGRPIPLDRRTGALLTWGSPNIWTGSGGTWLTIAGDTLYSFAIHRAGVLAIQPYSLTNLQATGRAWGAGVVPQLTIRPRPGPGQIHEKGKVSVVVHEGRPYARKAYGIALSGNALLLGHEGAVTAERTEPIYAASLRFGLAGDDLAVHGMINDPKVIQAKTPWEGSCVELFGSGPGQAPIGQVFLIPSSDATPATAFRAQGGKQVPAPEIRLQTVPMSNGYELAALVPLSLLALSATNADVRLDAQVTVTGPDGTVRRDTLFGSERAYQDNRKFKSFRFKPAKAIPSPDQVKKTLAAEPANGIVMRGVGELWRAPVEGEARELAVADGRLFVSTDKGEITCFAAGANSQQSSVISQKSVVSDQSSVVSSQKLDQSKIQNLKSEIAARLRAAGMDRGFALVLGDADGRLAKDLAAQTRLQIVVALTDAAAAQALRERLLADTAWYGSRIHVQVVERLDRLPFAQYFANAVIVADALPGLSGKELYRVLRPCGGSLLCPGLPVDQATALIKASGALESEIRAPLTPTTNPPTPIAAPAIIRGKLPGALDWDTNPKEQTADRRVKWPLRTLWFGGPSARQIQEFGEKAPGPVPANGRSFTLGEDALTAVDAYNGAVLWSRPVPKAYPNIRAVDGVLYEVSDPGSKYGRAGRGDMVRGLRTSDECVTLTLGSGYFQGKGAGSIQMDARTGEQKKVSGPFNPSVPVSLKTPQTWPVEVDSNHLGTVSLEAGEKGLVVTLATRDPVVTPLDAWELFFDLRPAGARYGLYERGTFHVRVAPALDKATPASWSPITGSEFPRLEVSGTRDADGTKTVVVLPWQEIEKSFGARPSDFGFAVALNAHDGGANQHITRRYLFGDWAADGLNNGWASVSLGEAAPASTNPPAIMTVVSTDRQPGVVSGGRGLDPTVLAAPVVHPLTGEPVPKISEVPPGCGGAYFAASLVSGRHYIYDLTDNSGMRVMGGVKTGCSTPQVAALGLMLVAEESGHCVCNYPFRTTLAMATTDRRLNEDWATFYDRDVDTVVRQAHLNFGAPGDRRDQDGKLWMGFPRRNEIQVPEDFRNADHPLSYPLGMRDAQVGLWYRRSLRPSVWVPLDVSLLETSQRPSLEVETLKGLGPYRFNADRVVVRGTDRPWLYASGYRGLRKATLRLNFLKPLASTPAQGAVAVDGKLDEACWGDTFQSTNGAQRTTSVAPLLPYTGTRVAFRHDERNLYVGVQRPPMVFKSPRAHWTPALGSGTSAFKSEPRAWQKGASKPDALSPKDNWWRLIVGDRAGGKAVYLTVTPDGTRADARVGPAGSGAGPSGVGTSPSGVGTSPSGIGTNATTNGMDLAWTAPWESAVMAGTNGMTVEMAIPWATLEAAGLNKDQLAVNFMMLDPDIGTEALTYLGIGGYDHCSNFTPLSLGKPAAVPQRPFTVRLHFAEPDADAKPGQRVFDVKLQDQVVLKGLDVVKEAKAPQTALVKEFKGVKAGEALALEFIPVSQELTPATAPILNALEIVEEGGQ